MMYQFRRKKKGSSLFFFFSNSDLQRLCIIVAGILAVPTDFNSHSHLLACHPHTWIRGGYQSCFDFFPEQSSFSLLMLL